MAESNTKLECRGCGSTLEFNDADPSSKCTYCGTVNEMPDGPKCEQCGGSLEYEPGTQALKCPYCSTQLSLVKDENDLPVEADRIIPLTVDKKALLAAVEDYMITGDFTPDDLVMKGKITKLEMMYEPVYWFWGSFTANWTASFGYNRKEEYMAVENQHYYVDGKKYYRQVNVMKTRILTDWHPMSGVASDRFSLFGYAGNSKDERVRSLIEDTASTGDTEYSPDFLANVSARPFLASEDDVYSSRVKPALNAQIDAVVQNCGQGDKQKDWNWSGSINKSSSSLLVPVCHAQFEYSGKTYNFWTSGRNTDTQVCDALPVDRERHDVASSIKEKVSASTRRAYFPLAFSFTAAFIGCPIIHSLSHADLSGDFIVGYTVYNLAIVIAAFVFGYKRHSAIKTHWGYYVQDALSASMDRRKAALARRRAGKGATEDSDQDESSFTDDANESMPYMARTDKDSTFSTLGSALVLILILLPLTIFVLFPSSSSDKQASGQTAPLGTASDSGVQPASSSAPSGVVTNDEASNDAAQAEDLVNQGKYDQALPIFERLCSLDSTGNREACTAVRQLYSQGKGIAQDNARAARYYTLSCSHGSILGCDRLGVLNYSGQGVPQDYARAGSLFEEACNGGNMAACDNLGTLYEKGQGVSQNLDQARNLYKKSCDGGFTEACSHAQSAVNSVAEQGADSTPPTPPATQVASTPKPVPVSPSPGVPTYSSPVAPVLTRNAASENTWIDSATGLMWTKEDNGSPLDWKGAIGYCQNLQLGGYRGWRLPEIGELMGMYDAHENVSGRRGDGSTVAFHVKGNLVLSGFEWSNTKRKFLGGAFVIAFHAGIKEVAPPGTIGDGRALCVRHQ